MTDLIKYNLYESNEITKDFIKLEYISTELSRLKSISQSQINTCEVNHAVYAVKKYNTDGELVQLDCYNQPKLLNDHDYNLMYKDCFNYIICAVHKDK